MSENVHYSYDFHVLATAILCSIILESEALTGFYIACVVHELLGLSLSGAQYINIYSLEMEGTLGMIHLL